MSETLTQGRARQTPLQFWSLPGRLTISASGSEQDTEGLSSNLWFSDLEMS
jgi:hypothetical protein